jgi:protein tyrosine/serine phosphatase
MKKKLFCLFVIFVIILWGTYWYIFMFTNNFYTVVPDKFYRSSQPTVTDIKDWQKKYNIKSILNLRGNKIYEEDPIAIKINEYSKQHNITINSIELKSSRVLSHMELQNIINILDKLPKPLLVHCRNGVDRTGLVSAIAKILDNQTVVEAMQEFAWFKGFMPNREAAILTILFQDYQKWLDEHNLISNREYFIEWAKTQYTPYYYSPLIEVVKPIGTLKHNSTNIIQVKVTNISNHVMPFTTVKNIGVHLIWCYYLQQPLKGKDKNDEYSYSTQASIKSDHCIDNGFTVVNYNLLSKESLVFDVIIPPIEHKGLYTIEFDLVEKIKFKFSSYGNRVIAADFEVI